MTSWKKVVEIDSRISAIHKELSELYKTRSALVGLDSVPGDLNAALQEHADNEVNVSAAWNRQAYETLTSAWSQYDITIPSLKTLQDKLVKANVVISELSDAKPELMHNLRPVLIPPAKVLYLPISAGIRAKQGITNDSDYIDSEIVVTGNPSSWRLMVVYAAREGLDLGSPSEIIDDGLYVIGGYDTRGLGLREYTALTLQLNDAIDEAHWSLLLKGFDSKKPLVTGGFMSGRYRFETDDVNTVLDDNSFRPAVEIR